MSSEDNIIILDDDESMLIPLGVNDDEPSPKQIYNAIVGLAVSHNKLAKDVYAFQTETNKFLKSNKDNIEKIPQILNENKILEVKITKLEKQVDFINQKEKVNNIVINGVPKIAVDKLPIILHKITKILVGRDVSYEYISAMKVKPGSKSNPIVVKVTHERDKNKRRRLAKCLLNSLVSMLPSFQIVKFICQII